MFFRVAVVPAVVSKLVKKGFSVNIEENAGAFSNFPNKTYEEAGAKVTSLKDTFQSGNTLITISIYPLCLYYIFVFIFILMCLFISDIILKVRPLVDNEVQNVRAEGTLISFLYPAQNQDLIKKLSDKNVNAFGKILQDYTFFFVNILWHCVCVNIFVLFLVAMDCIPRISRAQAFDALSSMANVAGYRAVIEAAAHFPRFFSGETLYIVFLR